MANLLTRLQQGAIRQAASDIAAMPAEDPDKYLLTALALAAVGQHEQAAPLIARLGLHYIERFMSRHCGVLDDHTSALLGQHCLGIEPTAERDGRGISIFSFPKSGSTFFESIIQAYTGMSTHPLTSLNDADGVNLDTMWFEQAIRRRQIARGHLSANARCISRCLMFRLRPIFLHRNIFDCLLSYADHIRAKYYPYPFAVPEGPAAIDVAIFHMGFHYVEMFASWTHFARRSDRVLLLAFDDNRRDWTGAAQKALVHSGIPVDRLRLEQAVADAEGFVESNPFRIRYAKGGVRDRGLVDPAMKERIRGLYRVFPGVDFSPIDPGD